MNEYLTTAQHKKQIGYWVSEKGKRMKQINSLTKKKKKKKTTTKKPLTMFVIAGRSMQTPGRRTLAPPA